MTISRVVVAAILSLVTAHAGAEPVTTIRSAGNSSNRLDIAVLGDGYTATEIANGKYALDVETAVTGLFAQDPYSDYRNYFNVHRIDVTSAQSGADHPATGIFRNTALDSAYDCGGITRLICVDVSKVNAVLTRSIASAVAREVIIVIVNDTQYGGSGGSLAVASTNAASVEIVLHELGHSLGLLTDEYGGPPPPSCVNSVEPSAANATKATSLLQIKWNPWIDPATPLPTTGTTNGRPGLFEGAQDRDTGLYRPTYNSKMRSLGLPFYQINTEQLIRRFYNYASPIDNIAPSNTSVMVPAGSSQQFTVTTPAPLSHSLLVSWRFDGNQVGTGSQYIVTANASSGAHTLQVVVNDPTPFVRLDTAGVLVASRTWTITFGVGIPVVNVSSAAGRPGDTVTLAASISPAGLNGTVQFLVNGASISGSATYTSAIGAATQAYAIGLAPGSYVVQALFSSAEPSFSNSSGTSTLAVRPAGTRTGFDFDDDLKTDIGVFRPGSGQWFLLNSNGGLTIIGWGAAGFGDVPLPYDYDGDGKADIAVYRKSTGEWFILNSSTGGVRTVAWGAPGFGDIPVPADYDGDGKTDIAVFRTTTGEWFILNSNTGALSTATWGAPALGDTPVPADYDGDNKADIAVYRRSTGTWFIRNSSSGAFLTATWGAPALGDIPVPADYDGDGRSDIAVFRTATGEWFISNPGGSVTAVAWGSPSLGDIPVPADYDGDGQADVAVYRTSTGQWFLRQTIGGFTAVSFGGPGAGDVPFDLPQVLR